MFEMHLTSPVFGDYGLCQQSRVPDIDGLTEDDRDGQVKGTVALRTFT
jgi:hypothetical protein